MKDIIKKSILLGLGILSKTDKEIERAIQSLEKSKHLKAGEGEQLIREIMSQVKRYRKETADFVRKQVKKGLRETERQLAQWEKKFK